MKFESQNENKNEQEKRCVIEVIPMFYINFHIKD